MTLAFETPFLRAQKTPTEDKLRSFAGRWGDFAARWASFTVAWNSPNRPTGTRAALVALLGPSVLTRDEASAAGVKRRNYTHCATALTTD